MKTTHKKKVKKLHNSPYAISEDEIIGKGSFAVIKKAFNLQNLSEQLAAKVISVKEEQAITIKSELQMLKQLPHHPNLVNCMKIQISSEKNFYIIMEYCNQGNLEKFIYDKKNDLPQEKIWFFLKQFCDGYKVLYDRSIVHRDIKPENILIHNGNYKISDFGLAKFMENVDIIENMSSKGTPLYMAPELHLEKEGSSKVDVFSLGIILYRMAFRGRFPFFEHGRTYHSVSDYFHELMIKKLVIPKNNNRSGELLNLIVKMLEKDKEKRIGWKQIFGIQRIKTAIRNERKREIVPLDEFRKSLIIIANNSITDVKVLDNDEQKKNNPDEEGESQSIIIIEQAFNKQYRSRLEKKLYRTKLLYTFIDIANRRIIKTIEKEKEFVHSYISNQLDKIATQGLYFSLYIIEGLQEISGDWDSVSKGELMNFEDIFDSDKEIFSQKIKVKEKNQRKYIPGTYEDYLYNFLTEYPEYPKHSKKILNVITGFLIDLYDLVLKLGHQDQIQTFEKSRLELMQDEGVQELQTYMVKVQNIQQDQIYRELKKMGLLLE